MARVTGEQLEHWREHGYVVVPGFLTDDELRQGREALRLDFPTWEEYQASPPAAGPDFPVWKEFPFSSDFLNLLTVDPDIVSLVRQALGTDDVFVTQAILWAKYAGAGDWEQDHHMDYGNNTLVVPRDDGEFRQVPMILYYTDVDETLGPTAVVSQRDTAGLPRFPLRASRDEHPEIYEKEVKVTVAAGSLLLYSQQTFHRGTRMTASEGARFSQHIVWRRAGFEWMGWRAFPREGNDPNLARFLTLASVEQRNAVGFPTPGHAYWNDDTLAGVQLRYPDMDLTPYKEAMQ